MVPVSVLIASVIVSALYISSGSVEGYSMKRNGVNLAAEEEEEEEEDYYNELLFDPQQLHNNGVSRFMEG